MFLVRVAKNSDIDQSAGPDGPRRMLASALAGRCILVLLLILAAGCQHFQKDRKRVGVYEVLGVPPDQWHRLGDHTDEEVSSGWLDDFNDERLRSLVLEGLANNPSLQTTREQLNIVSEAVIITRSSQLPFVNSGIGANESASAFRESDGSLSSFDFSDSYSGNLNISWEIDIWGRLRNQERAAIRDFEAAAAEFRGARLSLAASIASAYCNLITAGQQVELSRQTRDSFERNFRITERNYKAGDSASSPLDVQFGRNNVASAERTLINRQLAENEARRTMEILLGRYPSAEILGGADLPVLLDEVPAGMPAGLLMRRPDLVAAAARLEAATERRIAARKNLLPSIVLTAGGSLRSGEFADLLTDPQSIAANVAASLSQPIYRGGALRSQVRQAVSRENVAVQNFARIVLNAFREVESALDREESLATQERYLDTELAQANLAEEQSSRDYSEGIVGILSVLEAQRRAFNARNAMIALRNSRIQNRIDLYLALGGGFEPENGLEFHSGKTSATNTTTSGLATHP